MQGSRVLGLCELTLLTGRRMASTALVRQRSPFWVRTRNIAEGRELWVTVFGVSIDSCVLVVLTIRSNVAFHRIHRENARLEMMGRSGSRWFRKRCLSGNMTGSR